MKQIPFVQHTQIIAKKLNLYRKFSTFRQTASYYFSLIIMFPDEKIFTC